MVSLAAPCEDEVRGMCILDPLGIDEVDGGTLRMDRFDLGVGSLRGWNPSMPSSISVPSMPILVRDNGCDANVLTSMPLERLLLIPSGFNRWFWAGGNGVATEARLISGPLTIDSVGENENGIGAGENAPNTLDFDAWPPMSCKDGIGAPQTCADSAELSV